MMVSCKQKQQIQQQAFSPRQFCRTGNGVISKIDGDDIYICCGASKGKCAVTDTERRVSLPVPYGYGDRAERTSINLE